MGRGAVSRTMTCRCEIWGVLNVTPDSFSDGGEHLRLEDALRHGREMLAAGADVVDVGGASSRPQGPFYGAGAAEVAPEEERARVVPVVERLVGDFGARVSVDTVRPEVARAALAAGATVVNDVSCARHDALLDVVAETGAGYVLMHTRGRGELSPEHTSYHDVVREVGEELLAGVERAIARGVGRERIWLDPGIGFAKTSGQSLALLARLGELCALGFPVLVGPSRKGFIAEAAPLADGAPPPPRERLGGTAAAVTAAVVGGARAVRVHDVATMRQTVLVASAMRPRAAGERAA